MAATKTQTPRTPFAHLCLEDQIAMAVPIARDRLVDGGLGLESLDHIFQLGEVETGGPVRFDSRYDEVCRLVAAAYALGIAVGQLVPTLGADGGAR